ncbi:hypothetical protein [Actinomadura madurae]|uniref:hypothetical protein n=1 Tax=Actinomadura madurae TaxID=1993 RepID=UPI0020D2490C|nr:hypothetical protein [Actinomadura madurae]MCP9950189.1 hypothetical protein [Actinomadura madurae]MCP9966957.1 hypothetical protein [Actinomadura madurae]MCQ0009042.1 hypothetical protein [Actinomadura madurae]
MIAVGALVVAVLAYAVSGTFRANVEPALCDLAGKDQIVTQVDPATGEKSAQVTLTGKGGLGVETGDRTDVGALGGLNDKLQAGKNGEIDVSAFAGLNAELGYRYDFNESEGGDPYGRAQRFLDTRRGPTWKRVLGGLGGTQGEALENGAATAVNGAQRGWNWVFGPSTGSS